MAPQCAAAPVVLLSLGVHPALCLFSGDVGAVPPPSLSALAAAVADNVSTAMGAAVRSLGRSVADLLPTPVGSRLKEVGRSWFGHLVGTPSYAGEDGEAAPAAAAAAPLPMPLPTGGGAGPASAGTGASAAAAAAAAAAAERQLRAWRAAAPLRTVCEYEFVDEGRAVSSVALSPCGALALACDASGRVLLVDTGDLAVIRIWKGYRGASCGWTRAASPAAADPVIWAPHRGVVEVWQRRHGPRRCALAIPPGTTLCRLLAVRGLRAGDAPSSGEWGASCLVGLLPGPPPAAGARASSTAGLATCHLYSPVDGTPAASYTLHAAPDSDDGWVWTQVGAAAGALPALPLPAPPALALDLQPLLALHAASAT